MNRLITIGEASEILGVSISTLRRWDREGRLIPEKTTSGHRRYDISKLKPEMYLAEKIGRLVISHKERPLRFGAELIFAILLEDVKRAVEAAGEA